MDIIGALHFPDAEAVAFVWPAEKTETAIPLHLDGFAYKFRPNIEYVVAAPIFEALDNSGFAVTRLPDPAIDPVSPAALVAEGGDGGGEGSGGAGPATDIFDADAVIKGNLDEVKARLSGLGPDQLAAVVAAEKDREQPRKGVIEAIEALTSAE